MLLHAVVVDKRQQRQGLASNLISYALQQLASNVSKVVCFCEPHLGALYLSLNFVEASIDNDDQALNDLLIKRYQAYKKYHPELVIFSYHFR